ncbi:hypothetical protein IQ07DRAFT_681540 [Pyrenochaeta sp. DS3sAY3a]|nr:hypothetical protein IQ07DRAFT_681540 [Pyrenochaeta sp. DS3sAY3a]
MATTTSANDRKRPRLFDKEPEFATVLVGPALERFTVHKELLIDSSEFFRGALTGEFKSAKEKEVTLKEDDPLLFEVFLHWLYHGHFPHARFDDDETLVDLWLPKDEPTVNFVPLYLFGDEYLIPKLKVAVLDELVALVQVKNVLWKPDFAMIDEAFRSLPKDDPMCHALVDIYAKYEARELGPHAPKEDLSLLNDEGGFRVCIEFTTMLIVRYFGIHAVCAGGEDCRCTTLDPCTYHDHDNDEARKACVEKRKGIWG